MLLKCLKNDFRKVNIYSPGLKFCRCFQHKDILPKMTKWSKRKISFPRGPSEAWQRYPSQEAPVKQHKDILPKRQLSDILPMRLCWSNTEPFTNEVVLEQHWGILPKRLQWSNTYQWGCVRATLRHLTNEAAVELTEVLSHLLFSC